MFKFLIYVGTGLISLGLGMQLLCVINYMIGKKVYKRPMILTMIISIISFLMLLATVCIPRLQRVWDTNTKWSYKDLCPQAYEEGYEAAINDAELKFKDESIDLIFKKGYGSYTISFNGVDHNYIYERKE